MERSAKLVGGITGLQIPVADGKITYTQLMELFPKARGTLFVAGQLQQIRVQEEGTQLQSNTTYIVIEDTWNVNINRTVETPMFKAPPPLESASGKVINLFMLVLTENR
jgi:hypothetical protein